jgi:hypothetical protein
MCNQPAIEWTLRLLASCHGKDDGTAEKKINTLQENTVYGESSCYRFYTCYNILVVELAIKRNADGLKK